MSHLQEYQNGIQGLLNSIVSIENVRLGSNSEGKMQIMPINVQNDADY